MPRPAIQQELTPAGSALCMRISANAPKTVARPAVGAATGAAARHIMRIGALPK